MAATNTVTTAQGIYKRVYDKSGIKDLRPKSSVAQRLWKFQPGKRIGESYQVSVALQMPNGFHYVGNSGGEVTLNASIAGVYKQASIQPFEMDLTEKLTYGAVSRALESGDAAFESLLTTVMSSMMISSANRLEASIIRGQSSLGTVESLVDNGDNTASVVFTAATWIPGLWWAMGKDSQYDSFTSTTLKNTGGALGLVSITSSTRTVKFSFTGAIGTQINVGDNFYFRGANAGAGSFNEMPGLIAQSSNLTGTSLGIDASTNPNWAGNTYDVAGNISVSKVEDMVSGLRERGADGTLIVMVGNKAYSVLATEFNALRQVDYSYNKSKGVQGVQSMTIVSSEVGEIDLVQHPFIARGEALVIPQMELERIGASDITSTLPGVNKELFTFVETSNTFLVRTFCNQCVIDKGPNHSLYATGITY